MSSLAQISTAAVDRDNPWPGLASFTEDSRSFFFGREKETEELVRLIRRNTLTVLFGQSGLGKSSLLQAGAFPQLRDADFLPLYLRLDHSAETTSLADQVKAALVDAFKSVGADAPAPRADETLWEYFHRKDIDIWSAKNRLLTPVLAFDQFEEIFTLGRASEAQRERGRAFLTELADLVENRAPAVLREKFDSGELDIARYNFDKPSCQVVLSLREDFLPDLEGLKHEMRSILHSRMRVKRLDGTQALEIVQRPAPHLIAEGVAERIVEFVAGARGGSAERLAELEVEPALLSVICRELNERRRSLGQTQITADLVSGNRREILTDFYERSVADLPADMRAFVEDHLLTKSGFRDNLALETALEFPRVTHPLIDTLVARRLLRIEDRLGVQRVELTHDVLAEVIRGSRDTRQQRTATEQLRARERITRRRMWLARIIAAGLLVGFTGVSWIAYRAIHAEREQTRLRADAESARKRADALRVAAETQELAAKRVAYASDMNALQRALDMDNLGRARELLNRHRPKPGEPDLRGWEWRYLWQLCQSDARAVLREANDLSVDSVAASADGKWVAVGSYDRGDLSIINLETKETLRLNAGERRVRVAFSPRAPLLAFSMLDGRRLDTLPATDEEAAARVVTIGLWDVTTRQIVRELAVSGNSVGGLDFAADGQSLIVWSSRPRRLPSELSIWRVADGANLGRWPVAQGSSSYPRLAITRDASAAAISKGRSEVAVIDLKTGVERWSAVATNDVVIGLAFSPDGRILASGAGFADSTIRLWDAATGRELGRLEGNRGWTSWLTFLADGKRLVSSSADQTLRLWDLETRRPVRTFRGHKTEVWSFAILPDQRTLVSGSKDGSVLQWDLEGERSASSAGTTAPNAAAWTFTGSSEAMVVVGVDGRVVRRQGKAFQNEVPLFELGPLATGPSSNSPFVVLDPRRPLLAASTTAGKLQVWDWERGVKVWEKSTDNESGLTIPRRFTADGTRLQVSQAQLGRATYVHQEWEIATGRQTGAFEADLPNQAVRMSRTAHSPDGGHMLLFSPTVDAAPNDIDLRNGHIGLIKTDITEPNGAAWTPDGRKLVISSRRGYVRILDASTYQSEATLGGYMFGVSGVAFSADGNRLAVGSTASESLSLWDYRSRERLLTLSATANALFGLTFSPDGNTLAGMDSTTVSVAAVYFWRAPSWAEIEKTEATANRGQAVKR